MKIDLSHCLAPHTYKVHRQGQFGTAAILGEMWAFK